ncbi:SPBc2 prophage-derived uncharacterized protein YorZ [Bacillus subtilis]|uniref:hypothetical protein n=1 Tax=Bacillus subtilis TaxID=1423 RepID=UPI000863A5FB|nr:hypothetical protein [Bacillus subtilis]AOL97863.1 SPBc2 prophage-derived uncharacterized protein YorZ [Bacillus subtilis]
MNHICDICKEYINGKTICLRISDDKTYVDFNCCEGCAKGYSEKVKKECSNLSVKKTLEYLRLNNKCKISG